MNYERSTQQRYWTFPADETIWRSPKEKELVANCVELVFQLHSKCGLASPRRAFVTAAHYIHRYFAVEPIETCNKPRHVALACLFLAGKVEEIPWTRHTHGSLQNRGFTAEAICRAAQGEITMTELVEIEREVLEALNYCLIVHPARPIPAPGSEEEQRETLLLTTTRACLSSGPEEFSRMIRC